MSQDDTLRLAAEIADRWSGPLRDMQRALMRMQDQQKAAHKHGTTEAKKQRQAVLDLDQSFGKLTNMLKTGFTPALAAVGVTTLTVGGAIDALKNTVLGFASATRQLQFLSRETGLTINQLRVLDATARRIGTSPDAMNAAMQSFAQHMSDMRHNVQSEIASWGEISNPFFRNFAQNVSRLPIGDALSKVIAEAGQIPNQQQRRLFLEKWGLPKEFANVPAKQLLQTMADVHHGIGDLGPDAVQNLLKFETALNRLEEAFAGLGATISGALAPDLTQMTDAIRTFVAANKNELVDALKGVAKWVEQTDWPSVAKGIGSVAQEVGRLATHLGNVESIIKDIGNIAIGRMLFGVPGAVAGAVWNHPPSNSLNQTPAQAVPSWMKRGYHWLVPHSSGWATPPGLIHKESFSPGGNGLFQPAAFTIGGGNDPASIIAKGTRIGMLEALREWQAYSEGNRNSTGGFGSGGGFRLTGYEPGGGGAGAGIGGVSGAAGARRAGSILGPSNGPGYSGGSSDSYIAARRAAFAKELSDPNNRLRFAAMLLSEGTPLPTAESAMNRSLYAHESLMQMLRSGFYGPINRGELPSYMARLRANPKLMARMNAAIDRALRGSDTIHGATDQGMYSDPNGRWPGGRTVIGGQVFNDWGGGPGGHAGAAQWRRQFEAGASLHQHWSTGEILRALGASFKHTVTGEASMHVHVSGLPRASRVAVKAGGIFRNVTLSRGKTMVPAAGSGD